jgi:2Fe-2S ferredoxin
MVEVKFIECNGDARTVQSDLGTSLMRSAVENDIPGIVADCGGSLTCATCHIYVDDAWLERVGRPSETEEIMLDCAMDPRPTSRLSCQVVLTDELDGLVVHVPRSQF